MEYSPINPHLGDYDVEGAQRTAKLEYTEAAVLAEKIIRLHHLCRHGQYVVWQSCRLMQKALDDARRGG